MKKKNYLAYVYKKLILWLIISALLTVGFGELSYKQYDFYVKGLKDGNNADNLTCYLTARYLSCALRNDPRINQYKSRMKVIPDYEYFAKIKDNGSLETLYQTDYEDFYYEIDRDGEYYERSFENLNPINFDVTSVISDNGKIYYVDPGLDLDEQIAEWEKLDKGKNFVPYFSGFENRITKDPTKNIYNEDDYQKNIYELPIWGNQHVIMYYSVAYNYCLNRTDLEYFMDRAHEFKKLQNTHALISGKIRSFFPWLDTDESDYEDSPWNSLMSKYYDLYDDDLKMDDTVNPKWFELNNKKYQVGNWKAESGLTCTIPSVYKKPEKLLSRYKRILEPQKINVRAETFDSAFESDDRETNLMMNYGFRAEYSDHYFYNYGHLVQYGVIKSQDGYYYYAFATPLEGFWKTEGNIILIFFVIVFAAGFILINLFSILPYIIYTNRYKNEVFKNGLIDALAHNLKTPMQIISVNAENIKDTDSPEEKDGHADIILSQTGSVNDMVEKILKAADRKPVKTVFEIREVIEQMAEKTGAGVVINGTGKIRTDREFFEQAIYNLIDNANKYRSEGDILVNIKRRGIEIVNPCDSEVFTPGAGIAIADRFLVQNGMRLKLKVNDGKFIADINI